MTPSTDSPTALEQIAGARIIQLGHVLEAGQTANPGAVPFSHALTGLLGSALGQVPGQSPRISGVADTISLGCHTGTHMDSLAHVSYDGKLVDGTDISAPGVQQHFGGVYLTGRENFRPIVARGVLLDFARHLGVPVAPQDFVVTPELFHACAAAQGVQVRQGDVVLFRMGYDTLYRDREVYLRMPIPGPDPSTARLLVELGVVATGSDTMPYEAAPGAEPMQVHAELIPKGGVFILEMLDLQELAASGASEFLFVVLPLRIAGGTGSPVNPVAVLA